MVAAKEVELTPVQQKVAEVVQHELIDPHFNYNDSDFEILSTIRYDSHFTSYPDNGEPAASKSNNKPPSQSEVDPRICLLSENEPFNASIESDLFLDFVTQQAPGDDERSLEEILGIFNEAQNTVVPLTPPIEVDSPNDDENLEALWKIFYNRFLLLGEHFKRLNLALEFFGWNFHVPLQLLLEKLVQALPSDHAHDDDSPAAKMRIMLSEPSKYKMRVLLSSSGKMRIEAHPLAAPKLPPQHPSQYFINEVLSGFLPEGPNIWNVYIDSKPMPISPFTTFKTTKRDHYTEARNRLSEMAQKDGNSLSNSEILVYNSAFELMEGTITNVALFRQNDGQQYYYATPLLSSGCLCGVMRYYLLKKKLICEESLDVRDLKDGDVVLLFNGVMGCVKGLIKTKPAL
ncbi:LAMI_0F15544g1_1 [Lachancea mirantina]|uniref:LAMI_0F15544g1_1 n=1 Tax=Lachancea mirantina TaxID=1230905 RepID=A0A1G4K4P8_9SACH|nr:LAMI_0F15544g1_1 [Lachancea mirantina]